MTLSRLRGDGFNGQHMVVLPEPVCAAARRHALLRGLHVTDAGYFPAAVGHFVERAAGAPTTLVIFCMRGTGWVQDGDTRRDVTAGNLVWLPARKAHAYGGSEADPWTIAWVHFNGDEVAAWRELLDLDTSGGAGVVALPVDRLDEIALDHVCPWLERGYALRHQVAAAAALRSSLSAAAELSVERPEFRSARERVAASVARVQREWARPHRLEELATAAGMCVAHYSTLFRRHTGFAPIDFLIRRRVQQACRLLDTTKLSVREIAEQVGYADAYYFTRCFRRVMGCAPRRYREIQKG